MVVLVLMVVVAVVVVVVVVVVKGGGGAGIAAGCQGGSPPGLRARVRVYGWRSRKPSML